MGDTILLRRGTAANLPALQEGEPGWCTDTETLYIGGAEGSVNGAVRVGGHEIDALTYLPNTFTQATIEAALTAIGTTNKVTLLLRPGTANWVLTDDLTITANVTLKTPAGTIITIPIGKILTINGPFDADLSQHFNCLGTGKVVFGDGAIKEGYPQWWGGAPDGSTNSTATINAAIIASKKTYLSPGTWMANIVIDDLAGVELYGAGRKTIVHTVSATEPCIKVVSDAVQVIGISVHDMELDGNDQVNGLYLNPTHPYIVSYSQFYKLYIKNVTSGLYLNGGASFNIYGNTFSNIIIVTFSKYGIYDSRDPEETNQSGGYLNNYNEIYMYDPTGNVAYAVYNCGSVNSFSNVGSEGIWHTYGQNNVFTNIVIENFGTQTVFPEAYIFGIDAAQGTVLNGLWIVDDDNKFPNVVVNVGVATYSSLNKIRYTNGVAPAATPLYLDGGGGIGGTISNVQNGTSPKIDTYITNAELDRWAILNSPELFTNGLANRIRNLDLHGITYGGALMLTSVNVSLAADGNTVIYTVPTGKRCVLTHAILVVGADAGTTTISIGDDAPRTNFIPANTLSNLDAANEAALLMPIPNTTPLKRLSYAAGTVIEAAVASHAGGATNTLYLFGFLY